MDIESVYNKLLNRFPGVFTRNEPLHKHTCFQIGGNAGIFCLISSIDLLKTVLLTVRELEIPYAIIGGGSNLLVDDGGFRGLVIKFMAEKDEPVIEFPLLKVHAGKTLASVLDFAAEHSLSGLEFLAGIPGTIGGGVYMNAGAFGSSISEILHSARIITGENEITHVTPDYFHFSYRDSILQHNTDIVIDVSLRVKSGTSDEIVNKYIEIKKIRSQKHPPLDTPCAGSYFKNLPPDKPDGHRRPAGYFLEQAGAKSLKSGAAAVYHKHANMIINTGGAKARDVLQLAEKMKTAVYEKFHIRLEEEVCFLDEHKGILRNIQ